MPTPSRYNKIALKLLPQKSLVLGFAGLGFILILFSIFAPVLMHWNLFPLSGFGLITLIWSWGLFLVTKWFGIGSKKESKLPMIIRSGFRWYAAIFLDIWFVVGSFAALQIIWKSGFK